MILQKTIPYAPFGGPRLPGVSPLDPGEWLLVDDAYGAQMALRDDLLARARGSVLALDPAALPAAQELFDTVLAHLARRPDFDLGAREIRRPDGQTVRLDRDDPLGTLGQLVQEDLCLLQKPPGAAEHVLTGAVLCFPASWTLAQKFMRPLIRIHRPVAEYDPDLARRVQRLFDGVRPGRPLWRRNALWYTDPSLHQPRPEGAARPDPPPGAPRYLRSERQCLWRLPDSGAVVFSIHTYVLSAANAAQQGVAG